MWKYTQNNEKQMQKSLPHRINFSLNIVNNNRGWILVKIDILNHVMQSQKN